MRGLEKNQLTEERLHSRTYTRTNIIISSNGAGEEKDAKYINVIVARLLKRILFCSPLKFNSESRDIWIVLGALRERSVQKGLRPLKNKMKKKLNTTRRAFTTEIYSGIELFMRTEEEVNNKKKKKKSWMLNHFTKPRRK